MDETSPNQGGMKLAILAGLVLALIGANVFLFYSVSNLRTEVTEIKGSLLAEIAKVRESSSITTAANHQHMEALREELETTRRQANSAVGKARTDALKHADQLAHNLQEEQAKQQAQVNTELSAVKDATTTANTKIADVSTDVGNVKTEVASTKSDLEKTISDLKSVRGDLGVQSGLVATNGKELAALKALGERNYFEFTLAKTKAPQKVGNIAVLLKKADPKRNRYTVEVIADDKTVEKKEKTANEPVQFYVSGARQPYEIVVNQVKKDQIVGYLATPKVTQVARNQN
jgi:hypothetical protein